MVALEDLKISQRELLNIVHTKLDDLPPLPAVVVQVMETVNKPGASASDLNRLISMDQALSAKVLRLVNSAHYGFPSKVTTITHAIVILGFSEITHLATTLGVAAQFKPTGPHYLDRREFWAHSVSTAVAAGVVARRRRQPAKVCEEVFVGGLLHDLGKLFLDQYFAEQFHIAIELATRREITLLHAEAMVLGIDHVLVGKRIATNWRFNETSAAMISLHHEPQLAHGAFEHAASVHVADILSKRLKLGWPGDNIVPDLDPQVERWLAFTPEDWEAVEAEILQKFEKAKEIVSELHR